MNNIFFVYTFTFIVYNLQYFLMIYIFTTKSRGIARIIVDVIFVCLLEEITLLEIIHTS